MTLKNKVFLTEQMLQRFGGIWTLHKESLHLTLHLKYLELVPDTSKASVSFPAKISNSQVQVLHSKSSLVLCMRVFGLMVTSFYVGPFAHFHSRNLQHNISLSWDKLLFFFLFSVYKPIWLMLKSRLFLSMVTRRYSIESGMFVFCKIKLMIIMATDAHLLSCGGMPRVSVLVTLLVQGT